MNTHTPFYILSGAKAGLPDEENAARARMLRRQLQAAGYDVMDVCGRYNGTNEQSFLVLSNLSTPQSDTIRRLSKAYGQETYLYVDANRYATLHAPDDMIGKPLGLWRTVDKEVADTLIAVTQTADGIYWAGTAVRRSDGIMEVRVPRGTV